MKKKTLGVLLTTLLLSVYCVSVYADGGTPFNDIWDYINNLINPTLEDHETRITALEGSGVQVIQLGMTSASTETYAETVILAGIVAEDINKYATNLGLDMAFEFAVKDNLGQPAIAWENTKWFKQNGIDLIIGHPWSGQCRGSLDYVNENNMLLISASSTDPYLAIPNDRLFRTSPNDGVYNYASAEMWETWGVEAVLIMELDGQGWGIENFEYELGIREIESLGRILYWEPYVYELAEANDTITDAIAIFGVDKVGIQFIGREEIEQLQTEAADYPNLMDVIWMTTEGVRPWMLDETSVEFGHLAVQTRHFSPIMRHDEPFFQNQEFADKYYELTGSTPRLYVQMQYDACWLLAEAIIKTGSTDAGVISTSLIPISHKMHGLSGWLALDENGDRIPQIYDISGFYEDESGEYKVGTFGSYDGRTKEVQWYDDALKHAGVTRPTFSDITP